MSHHDSSRRKFLSHTALLGAATTLQAHEALAGALIRNLFVSSVAEASSLLSPRYYVNLFAMGAPPRYTFDHWLRTNSDDPSLVFNPGSGTAFDYNSSTRQTTGPAYKTFNFRGVQVPQLFATLSPADREAFLDSFLVIRGYSSGIDGHSFNAALQMHPLAGAPSLSGLLADNSEKYFQAVQYGARFDSSRFISEKSVSLNKLTSQQPLDELLKPIVTATDTARNLRTAQQDIFANVRAYLSTLATDQKAVKIARSGVSKAYDLMNSSISDFSSAWPGMVSNYQTAIDTAVRANNLPYLNATSDGSQSIANISDGSNKYKIDASGGPVTIANGKDLLGINTDMSIAEIAQAFALAEYCIVNDLASSIELRAGDFLNLKIDPAAAYSATNSFKTYHDMHSSSYNGVIYVTSLYYRGMIAAMLEFRSRLMAAGKWNQTLVQFSSDFGRQLGPGGIGTGHGFDGMISSVFSGVLTGGPYVVGNVAVSAPKYTGSQGIAAPIAGYNISGRPPVTAMASTVSQLMAVPKNPWNNLALPLVNLNSDGTLFLPFGKGKLIA